MSEPVNATEALLASYDELQERLCSAEDPDPERALAMSRQVNAEPLGLGSGRLALPLGPAMVAKVAWRESGLVDNEIEWRIWQSADEELRSLLCPALELRESRLLVQGRCMPIAGTILDERTQRLVSELGRHGISDAAINLGMNEDNQIVCYDYALIRPELFGILFPELAH